MLLAVHEYNPNAQGTETLYTTTARSLVDVDAQNMAVSFIAPESGAVIVRVTSHWIPSQSGRTKGGIVHGGLREDNAVVAGPNLVCRDVTGNGYTSPLTTTLDWFIEGLEPGSQHTYKLAYCADMTTGATVGVAVGGALGTNSGRALFQVWDAAC